MIAEFVQRWDARKDAIRAQFAAKHPDSYDDVVKAVVTTLAAEDKFDSMDPERIHKIDDGSYQGTLVYVIACGGYQPSDYWYVKVGYGSCSGCDTLEGIRSYTDDPPNEEQINDYMTLALHIVQGIKKMGEDYA